MGQFITNIRQRFAQADMPMRFIYVNVAVFLFTSLFSILFMLFKQRHVAYEVLDLLWMPASIERFLYQPWSIITYMFMHADVFHLLFNMLLLYWFGRLFVYFYTSRAFGGLYLFGGLCGGLLYMLFYNVFPYFDSVLYQSDMVGASASVLAITVATAMREPDYRVQLLLFGNVRLKYIAIALVMIDLLMITSSNAGGHIAHLGGDIGGLWFALALRQGRDITAWISRILDGLTNLWNGLFQRKGQKPKMKINYGSHQQDYDYNARKKAQSKEIDRILDKLKKSGYGSLSTDEKKSLFDASKK